MFSNLDSEDSNRARATNFARLADLSCSMSAKAELDLGQVRKKVLTVCASVGEVCGMTADNAVAGNGRERMVKCASSVLCYTIDVSVAVGIDLGSAIDAKMELNDKKYPVHHCGSSVSTSVPVCSGSEPCVLLNNMSNFADREVHSLFSIHGHHQD